MRALASVFENVWGARAPEPDALESTLRAYLEAARSAFPDVPLNEAHGVEHLARRVPAGEDPVRALGRLRVHELLLASACADGASRAIAAFDEGFLKPAAAALIRAGENPDAVEEAKQILLQKLLVDDAKILDFSGQGTLAGWSRVSLARTHTSLQRSKGKTVSLDDKLPNELPAIDPELAAIRRRYGDTFRTAFHDSFGALTPDQRTVLRLHFVDGLNLAAIAPILGVSRATVGRRLLEARNALQASVLKLLGERVRASPSEIESLLALVRSTLHASLGQLLRG